MYFWLSEIKCLMLFLLSTIASSKIGLASFFKFRWKFILIAKQPITLGKSRAISVDYRLQFRRTKSNQSNFQRKFKVFFTHL
ncbi:hypothetical protein RB195_005214 [Necator americanus]|uniref:Secreted protein n=1 Tax=Necator americanus TaxID=51031 RepID=A0ABR1BQM6_NECAM